MAECKGLVYPHLGNIQELLNMRQWDANNLASRTELDLRTVESVLRGERKQCVVMEKIASEFGVPLCQIVNGIKKDETAWPSYTGIQIHKNWEPTWPAIETARESVLIVDSIFLNEHGRLGPALKKNATLRSKPLEVSIYMTSSKRPFGAQRMREKDCSPRELIARRTSVQEGKQYTKTLRTLVAGIRQFSDCNAVISLFEYVCMPSLRIVRVDQVHFYWGWFPIAAQNPHHICFYVQGGSQNAADNELCKRLEEHIEKVSERSTSVK